MEFHLQGRHLKQSNGLSTYSEYAKNFPKMGIYLSLKSAGEQLGIEQREVTKV